MASRTIDLCRTFLCGGILASLVAGCSSELPYPSTFGAKMITENVLTPAEQQTVINEMTKSQETHNSSAEAEIEKRK
ncbi:MAG: hypothetical protein V3V97_10800 [Hyphomicrobiaceae bacterium]